MVIICRVELVSPNIERKYLKTNKYFKNRQAGNSKIGIMNTNSWGLRQKWSATAASGTRVVYSVPEKGVSGTEYPFRTGNACFLHRMLHHLDHFCRSYNEWLDGEVLDISCHEVGVFFGKSHFVEYDVFRIWEIDAFS